MVTMRLFIASTAEELEPYRSTAEALARELGFRLVALEPATAGSDTVPAQVRRLATADVVLAIVGAGRGEAPTPELGGDGVHPWAWWVVRAGFDRGIDVRVMMVAAGCGGLPPETDPNARSVMRDFRAELARLAVFFDGDDLEDFCLRLRETLIAARDGSRPNAPSGIFPAAKQAKLRRWPAPPLPPVPYPVLLPYAHPELLAGRDRELRELRQLIAYRLPVLGLHAASGTGKSSILGAGLVPGLRAEGRPVAFERHPTEPGIVRRLLGDLLAAPVSMADDDARGFVDRMRELRDTSGAPPVLILDQLEDLFPRKEPGDERDGDQADRVARRARRVVARLLAASVQRQPGLGEPPCRWLLAYRQEFHGRVFQWLGDLSHDLADDLPHDLTGVDRFLAWALPPLGTPSTTATLGIEDRTEAAARIFREVIEKPLKLTGKDGRPVYPYRFAPEGTQRMARLFGEARVARRNAPLATELQVMLAHWLQGAGPSAESRILEIAVPEDTSALLDHALEDHLRRSLDHAFPARKSSSTDPESRIQRTRALLALRELAGLNGQPEKGKPIDTLAKAIGEDGRDVLERLSTARTRIVFLQMPDAEAVEGGPHLSEPIYRLAHDRMAEVIVRQVDDERTYAGLGIDADLLALRRFVALQRQLFSNGEVEQATAIPKSRLREIERHADCLLWDAVGQRWWRACRERQERERRRLGRRLRTAVVLVGALLWAVGVWASRTVETRELLDAVEHGDPEASLAALARLSAKPGLHHRMLDHLARRKRPFEVLERGLGGVERAARGSTALQVAELLLALQRQRAPEDPRWIASIVWALDLFARPEPALKSRAKALRDEVLAHLRAAHPPPPLPERDDPAWSDVLAGTFRMGLDPEDLPDGDPFDESPAHQVTVSAFRIMTHEVTFGDYRRLTPDLPYPEPATFPAGYLSWYEAYTYAAWLGGRLPTEAEWEYAARAGCRFAFCRRDGSEAELSDVAWWTGNTVDARTREPGRKPVGLLEPNPTGLYDVYGNVHEWTADWAGLYDAGAETDPAGPPSAPGHLRTFRGGCAIYSPTPIGASRRAAHSPEAKIPQIGFRVVLPLD